MAATGNPQADGASSLTITELSGDQRKITLVMRALPYRGLSFKRSQRNSIEWYPGNPVGVLQVYGKKHEPTQCNGAWKDIFLGDGTGGLGGAHAQVNNQVILTAAELVDLFDDVCGKGQELEVAWAGIVRRGILEDFEDKWENLHDCFWTMSFKWISAGEQIQDIALPSTVTHEIADSPGLFSNLVNNITQGASFFDNMVDTASDWFYAALNDTIGQVNQIGAAVMGYSDDLTYMASALASFTSIPNSALTQAAGIYDGMKLTADDLYSSLQDTVDGMVQNVNAPFGVTLANRAAVRSQSDNAFQMSALAAAQEQQVLSGIRSNVLAIYQAKANDDLRYVSQAYYGTPDDWRGLMIYNQLVTDELSAGQIVIVPVTLPRYES